MRVPDSRPVRVGIVLAGALVGGAVAGVFAWLPTPYPVAIGIAAAVPVMDVGLYPENVPDDGRTVAIVGVVAALGGAVAGCAAGWAWTELSLPFPLGLAVGVAYLATELGGRRVRSRLN